MHSTLEVDLFGPATAPAIIILTTCKSAIVNIQNGHWRGTEVDERNKEKSEKERGDRGVGRSWS